MIDSSGTFSCVLTENYLTICSLQVTISTQSRLNIPDGIPARWLDHPPPSPAYLAASNLFKLSAAQNKDFNNYGQQTNLIQTFRETNNKISKPDTPATHLWTPPPPLWVKINIHPSPPSPPGLLWSLKTTRSGHPEPVSRLRLNIPSLDKSQRAAGGRNVLGRSGDLLSQYWPSNLQVIIVNL